MTTAPHTIEPPFKLGELRYQSPGSGGTPDAKGMDMADTSPIDRDALPLGAGALGLGVVGLLFSAFALQWQPVPAALAGSTALAMLSAVILVLGGAAAMLRRTVAIGALILAFWFGLWVVALHAPLVIAQPSVVSLLGFSEILALAAAAWQIYAMRTSRTGWVAAAPRYLFGICPLVFGVSHFVYADFTAAMVPSWLPGHLFWAYATGVGHLAAGLAILAGVRARLAATCLAAMCGSFVLLLHLPRALAMPGSHAEWTMTFIALSIAGAAWAMRTLR